MYKTACIPKMVDGVIRPTKNVAKIEFSAVVLEGIGGRNMLNENLDFACHESGHNIVLQFNQSYYIDSLRMLLGNAMNHLNRYSFCIETSLNQTDWEMAVDKRDETLSGWQEFNFVPRPALFIKITGTQSDNVSLVFVCFPICV